MRVDAETKPVACLGAGDGFMNPAHERMGSGVDVKEDFAPHRLHDFHHGLEVPGRSCGNVIVHMAAVFRSDAIVHAAISDENIPARYFSSSLSALRNRRFQISGYDFF